MGISVGPRHLCFELIGTGRQHAGRAAPRVDSRPRAGRRGDPVLYVDATESDTTPLNSDRPSGSTPPRRFERYVAIGDSSTEGLDDPDGQGGFRGLGPPPPRTLGAGGGEALSHPT